MIFSPFSANVPYYKFANEIISYHLSTWRVKKNPFCLNVDLDEKACFHHFFLFSGVLVNIFCVGLRRDIGYFAESTNFFYFGSFVESKEAKLNDSSGDLDKTSIFGLLSNTIRNCFILSRVLVHCIFNISVIPVTPIPHVITADVIFC